MKLLIIGYGLIGRAIVSSFKRNHEIVVIDPNSLNDNISEHNDSDGCIICHILENSDGVFDISRLTDVIDQLPIYMPIMIKSSLSPEHVDQIHERYHEHSIVISPDFSRERTIEQDFLNQQYIVIGGEDPDCFWQDLFQSQLPNCKMVFNCSDKEAAFIKYATNGFLALKTSYFNQLYDLCNIDGMDFDIVRQILTNDNRIGSDHSMVPGPDCTRGWAGKAFAKDIYNFITWADNIDTPLSILTTITKYNDEIRK